MNETTMEKRKTPRIITHIPVRYSKLKDGSSEQGTGSLSKDLSLGGICFRARDFIPMACRLILELELPNRAKPLKVISKIAWIRKTTSDGDFETGNHFLEVSKEDSDTMSEYVNYFA